MSTTNASAGPSAAVARLSLSDIEQFFQEGGRMFSKRALVTLNDQLREVTAGKVFVLRRLDGQNMSWKSHDCKGHGGAPHNVIVVNFLTYQDLVNGRWPMGTVWNRPAYLALSWYRPTVSMDLDLLEKRCAVVQKIWECSATCADLITKLKNVEIPTNIRNIICFGLGKLYSYKQDKSGWKMRAFGNSSCPKAFRDRAITQHAAAMTIAQVLSGILGHRVAFMAQDPEYDEADRTILRKAGFTVIGANGTTGFTMVDEETVVMSVACSVPVKQVVADIARPAMMIWEPSKTLGGQAMKDLFAADPESPRVVSLLRDYTEVAFTEKDNRDFGALSVYVRNQ